MKRKLKIGAIILTLAFALTGCSATSSEQSQSSQNGNSQSGNNEAQTSNETKSSDAVKKVGSVNIDSDSVEMTKSGIIYKNADDKYGVMSLDGKNDTGAKYIYADETAGDSYGYITVYADKSGDGDVNFCGLVDSSGKEVLETKYGYFYILSDRYAKVVTATSKTTNKDNALFYYTDKLFSLSPDSEDTMYAGKWQIYDLKNNKFIESVSGSLPYNMTAKGKFIEYVNDDKKTVTVDNDGNEITDERKILSNGSYVIEQNGNAKLYSTEGEELFGYSTNDYDISDSRDNYYLACTYSDDSSQYFLVDDSGKAVSSKFDSQISDVYPDFLFAGDKIFKFDGENVIEGEYSTLYFDDVNKDAYYVNNDSSYVIFDKKGNILYKDDNSENGDISRSGFNVSKKKDDSTYAFYNFTSKDFSIDGNELSDWLVSQESDEFMNVVETRSGKTIIKNYDHYLSVKGYTDGIQYVFAYNAENGVSSEGNFDIYTVN